MKPNNLTNAEISKKWWKEAVVYQVYPRSFMDSNGDGIGDIAGVTQKLDYLKELGVDVIWICPIYKSPQDDNGYDISDYQDIHHEFGSMADFDKLLEETHRRGMKLIMDLVINHTSDEHPWFIESKSSLSNSKRDWYIWKDGKNGAEPNNWESIFEGSAWKLDEKTRQYFLHLFSSRQPDLNWENLDVRKALYDMIHWWLQKGIDGFRIDAISHAKKAPGLPDLPNPKNLKFVDSKPYHMNYPGILDYIEDLCSNTFRKYDIMTVGEANGVGPDTADEWVGEDKNRLSMIIQFEHCGIWNSSKETHLNVLELKRIFSKWQIQLHNKGWNALFIENHDMTRIPSRWGDTTKYWKESSKSIAALYFLMQGSPFIYQGQEIGMTNTQFNGPDDFNDVYAKNKFTFKRAEGFTDEEILAELRDTSRDNARTPMQWNKNVGAGFTSGTPWLKINPNFTEINVEKQIQDPDSILNFYRKLIALRKKESVFIYGNYELIDADNADVYAYRRCLKGKMALVICNLKPFDVAIPQIEISQNSELQLTNYKVVTEKNQLRPFECRVYVANSQG